MAIDMRDMQWMNPPARVEPLPEGGIRVYTAARVDFFNDPMGKHMMASSHFLYKEVEGDFVATLRVRPNFAHVWDAGCLMCWQDGDHWAKLCYERTDIGPTAVVSVVTRGISDDANGAEVDAPEVKLRLARCGQAFAMHYAIGDAPYRMVRIFSLEVGRALKLGVNSQCPAGEGTHIDILDFDVRNGFEGDLRSAREA